MMHDQTTVTVLARKARTRKPNRRTVAARREERRGQLRRAAARIALLAALPFLAAFFAGTEAHAATVSYSGEANACIAVWAYRETDLHHYADEAWWQRDYRHAAHEARYADPALRAAIGHYLFTDHGWSQVYYDCGFGEN